jgi:hypothetical protein
MQYNYSNLYVGKDIDWFAVDQQNEIACFASGGGVLPDSIATNFDAFKVMSDYLWDLPENRNEVIVNPLLDQIKKFSSEKERTRYVNTFISMAKHGIYSYDKTIVMADGDYQYHLVVRPLIPRRVNELPSEVVEILQKTASKNIFAKNGIIFSNEIG